MTAPPASPLVLHAAPASGFDEPFEMLVGCHQRVQRTLGLLRRLAAHLAEHGADARAADAARDVLRYFDIAGPAHHEDEERHVLPWLAANGRAALAGRLHADHQRMAEAWAEARTALDAVAAGRWDAGHAAEVTTQWQAFAGLYEEHIEVEEREAFPPARAACSADALRAMGREMASRRGLSLD
jgi:hemerythrin-like domain-containing protein